jgi:flagellar protein FlaI
VSVGRKVVQKLARGYRKLLETKYKKLLESTEIAGRPVQTAGAPMPIAIPAKPEKEEVTGQLELIRKKRKEIGGYEIPSFTATKVRIGKLATEEEKAPLSLVYPLIPRNPKPGEPIFAYAKVFWDQKTNRYIYQVVEPRLSPELKRIMIKIKELLEQRLDVDFSKLRITEASEYINKQVDDLINYYGFKISPRESQILRYYIQRDFIGLGKIEPLMMDQQIEDISCDGVNIPLFVFHKNPNIGSVVTNVIFDDSEELNSFVIRLAQLTGKSISIAKPLLDGTLPDGSRLQATLATDIAMKGSNFTIRKFSEEPLTPIHLLNYKTIDVRSMAYMWLAVDFGRSILISGGTASGKTSLLNVLSLFIRPEKKIISIEDTGELRLPHPHWVPEVARSAVSVEGAVGEIDMFDLLKESLRQRPDYIIVGEVRGKEAYILFQQMATGHPSMATIHAENMHKLIDRLTTPPISLPPTLVSSLDLIVFLARMRYKDKFVRRVVEIVEMIEVDPETKEPITNQVFRWDPATDKFEVSNKSAMLKKISDLTGIKQQEIIDELERRMLVLHWMQENNIVDYKNVYKVINMYYTQPQTILAVIKGGA